MAIYDSIASCCWYGNAWIEWDAGQCARHTAWDGIGMDWVGRAGNADGMGRGSRILCEETWNLIDLYPIDPTLHQTN